MSKMSIWLGPPHWNRKITDFARGAIFAAAAVASAARRNFGIDMPSSPIPPARSRVRRAIDVSRKLWQLGSGLTHFRRMNSFAFSRLQPMSSSAARRPPEADEAR